MICLLLCHQVVDHGEKDEEICLEELLLLNLC